MMSRAMSDAGATGTVEQDLLFCPPKTLYLASIYASFCVMHLRSH